MADLTDINEILEYLTTVGINCKYVAEDNIEISSEYQSTCRVWNIIDHYKILYEKHLRCKLLDNLFIYCQIDKKYIECKYNVRISYSIYFKSYSSLYCHGCDLKIKNIDVLMLHMQKNHPECIRQEDIKIALK